MKAESPKNGTLGMGAMVAAGGSATVGLTLVLDLVRDLASDTAVYGSFVSDRVLSDQLVSYLEYIFLAAIAAFLAGIAAATYWGWRFADQLWRINEGQLNDKSRSLSPMDPEVEETGSAGQLDDKKPETKEGEGEAK